MCAVLLCSSQVWAHHAFARTYDPDTTVTIKGKVVEFLFRIPHSVLVVETPGEKGRPITWAAEWSYAAQLSRQGIEKDALKPGDQVIVTGNPSRSSADHRMRMESLTRTSDRWKWSSNF